MDPLSQARKRKPSFAGRHRSAATVAAQKPPVAAANSRPAERTFGAVVVGLEIPILEIARQRCPVPEHVGNGLTCLTFLEAIRSES